jgi:hypothetical protein
MVPERASSRTSSMASANYSTTSALTLLPITEKLTRSNFQVWKALVISVLKGAQLSEFLEGKAEAPAQILSTNDKKTKVPNPEFATYVTKQ